MPRRNPRPPLPDFVEPMLAVLGKPFESPAHVYEIKWDGFRSLVFCDEGGVRLTGRRRSDFTPRFPELAAPLSKLPPGTILDGEIVQLQNGRPNFSALLKRERAWSANAKPRTVRVSHATFIAFDLLYDRGSSVMHLPLTERLERLAAVIRPTLGTRVALSDVHTSDGLALFEQVNALGLEGVIAKRADSPYEPGGRTGAWIKFKRRLIVVCSIIGYERNATGGLKSLLLAAEREGQLQFVGKVGSGIGPATEAQLFASFAELASRRPAVACSIAGASWLRPGLFCSVSFAEWTNQHKLRQPVFQGIV